MPAGLPPPGRGQAWRGMSMAHLRSIEELAALCRTSRHLYLRVSRGPDADDRARSIDYATGLTLPGLSAIPLHPPDWWRGRPDEEWAARQVSSYAHLVRDGTGIWVLRGHEVGRGPDNEPLVEVDEPIGWLDDGLVAEAQHLRPTEPPDRPSG